MPLPTNRSCRACRAALPVVAGGQADRLFMRRAQPHWIRCHGWPGLQQLSAGWWQWSGGRCRGGTWWSAEVREAREWLDDGVTAKGSCGEPGGT